MFTKEYVFSGKHADMVKKLASPFGNEDNLKVFSRYVDILLFAPIIGFIYGRKSEIDKGGEDAKIFLDQLKREESTIKHIFQLITIVDEKNFPTMESRIDISFRNLQNIEFDPLSLFNKYILGGVEVLFEKIMEESYTNDDYLNCLYDFIEEFNEKYNEEISSIDFTELYNLAKM